jgi:hypothetical protein
MNRHYREKTQANVIIRREENAALSHLKELEYIERIAEKVSRISLSGETPILDERRELFASVRVCPPKTAKGLPPLL